MVICHGIFLPVVFISTNFESFPLMYNGIVGFLGIRLAMPRMTEYWETFAWLSVSVEPSIYLFKFAVRVRWNFAFPLHEKKKKKKNRQFLDSGIDWSSPAKWDALESWCLCSTACISLTVLRACRQSSGRGPWPGSFFHAQRNLFNMLKAQLWYFLMGSLVIPLGSYLPFYPFHVILMCSDLFWLQLVKEFDQDLLDSSVDLISY